MMELLCPRFYASGEGDSFEDAHAGRLNSAGQVVGLWNRSDPNVQPEELPTEKSRAATITAFVREYDMISSCFEYGE
ncbi:hypothetical protein JCM31598_43670 [Desulfonatronum parangueonense]